MEAESYHPLILSGLWSDLSDEQRGRASKLGFDQHSWDNNCREVCHVDEADSLYVSGVWARERMPIMTGDKSRKNDPVREMQEGC